MFTDHDREALDKPSVLAHIRSLLAETRDLGAPERTSDTSRACDSCGAPDAIPYELGTGTVLACEVCEQTPVTMLANCPGPLTALRDGMRRIQERADARC